MTRIVLFLTVFSSLANIVLTVARNPNHSRGVPYSSSPPTSASSSKLAAFFGTANLPRQQQTVIPPYFPATRNLPFPSIAPSNETAASPLRNATVLEIANVPRRQRLQIPPYFPGLPHLPPSKNGSTPANAPSNKTTASRRTAASPTTTSTLKREENVSNPLLPAVLIIPLLPPLIPVLPNPPKPHLSLSTTAPTPGTTASLRTTTQQEKIKNGSTKSFTKTTASAETRLSTTTIASNILERKNVENFVEALETNCDFDLLDAVYKDLKDLWVEAKKEITDDNQDEMEYLQKFVRNLVDQYSKCVEETLVLGLDRQYEIYWKIFGKEYIVAEREMRKGIFKKSVDDMLQHNELYKKGLTSYTKGLNQFSDWTSEELKMLGGFSTSNAPPRRRTKRMDRAVQTPTWMHYDYKPNVTLPDSFVWGKDYVTSVKLQGKCASCYAFAGIGALEAYHKKETGELIELSVQNILDCTRSLGNNGCEGGATFSVFDYARGKGVVANSWYPYTMNASHNCRWKYERAAAFDRGYYVIPKENEEALKHAVAKVGPVAVGIGTNGIHRYRAGVFQTSDCGPASHAALVVGYGTDAWFGDYWTVKNCWGSSWGNDGYVRIARNKKNMCYVASYAYLPY